MTQLETGFKKATAIPKGGTRALAKVISGKYDAYLTVITPSTKNKLFKSVLKNDQLKFIPIKDWDLNDKYEGKAIYTFDKIVLEKGIFDTTVETICTTASVFIRSDIDDDLAEGLAEMLVNNKNYILGK